MLAIEVEFLTGVSVAASPYRCEEAEWPPHPDRLFQALIAAWGRNDPPAGDERAALEWLEALDAEGLLISAPSAHRRNVAMVYVPPNDARTTGQAGDKVPRNVAAMLRVLPELRKNRQPRTFPAVLPALPSMQTREAVSFRMPLVRYVWPNAPGFEQHRRALQRLTAEVTYLGHSHTLVRLAIVNASTIADEDSLGWIDSTGTTLRLPYRGRLAELVEQYERSKRRGKAIRPNPSLKTRLFHAPKETQPPSTGFDGERVIVFGDAGGFCPSLVAFPLVAKRLRDALLKIADNSRLPIPTLLSGHDSDGCPTAEAHLAIVPLADVGWPYSHGRLMGVALVWPREVTDEKRQEALSIINYFVKSRSGKMGLLHFGPVGSWRLSLTPEPDRASLRFGRYARRARRWGTVLPVVLDRHPKDRPGHNVATIIARACVNAGLPPEAVDGVDIDLHKHAPTMGAPSVHEVAASLPKDSPYRGRPLRHLVLTFARPIRGPLILCAGRFRGLGLCLPLDEGP